MSGSVALKQDAIRDRLVVGMRDARLSQRLQLDSKLTLEKATPPKRNNALGAVTDLTAVQTAQLVMLLVTNAREKATIVHNVFLNLFPLILQQQSKSL